jgi:zinc protease
MRLLAAAAFALLLASCAGTRSAAPPARPVANAPVLLPVPSDPTVSFSLSFPAGSQMDPPGKEGLAYLTATLMAEGATARNSYAAILEQLYPMAAGYQVRVDVEQVTFTGRVHRDNLTAFTDLLLDAILRPAFAADDLERLRQRALAHLTRTLRYSSDEELGKAALYTAVFAGTPYGHLPVGTVAGLKAISVNDVQRFYRTHYTRNTVTLGLGGGFDDGLPRRLLAALAQLPAGAPPLPPPPAVSLRGRQVVIVAKPGPATAISFGFPIRVRRGQDDFYPLWVANSWFGEHRHSSSHLYQVIREARGLNYGDYSYIEHFPEAGWRTMPPVNVPRRQQLFEVWIRPVPNTAAHFALRAAVRELEKLVAEGLDENAFALTRDFLASYSLHYADTTATRLGYAVDDRFYGIAPPGHLVRFRQRLATMTREEVNAAVGRHLNPQHMVIAIVTERAGELAAALASEADSPITYDTPKPPQVLAEDALIARHPLRIPRERIRIVPVDELFER